MTIRRSITIAAVAALSLAGAQAPAQPAPLDQRIGGILVGDLTLDAIYLTRDLNGDGDVDDAGETTIYFDGMNESGLPEPTGSVFVIFQAADRHVFFGDGGSDAVYRLRDLNGDRDAQDPGEAGVWFDADNPFGFGLSTPNGIWQTDDGAVYLLTAGAGGTSDAIYRTVDLNGDGDAEDAGEATLWMDTQALVPGSSAFDLVFIGDVAYFADLVGGEPDAIYRAEDDNGNGVIDADEFNIFIDESNPFGVSLGFALVTDGVSLFAIESLASARQEIYRLTDLDGSGMIDDPGEVEIIWDESQVPAGLVLGSSFGLAIGPGGELALGSGGADEADNIFRLVDEDGDGDFLDDGETTLWAHADTSGKFVENPRALEYALPKVGDVDGDDVVGFSDLLAVLAAWGPCPGCPEDIDSDGTVGFSDLILLLAAWD